MGRKLVITAAVLSFAFVADVRRAEACSCQGLGPQTSAGRFPWFSAEDFPSNGLFMASIEWRTVDGSRLLLQRDLELTEQLGVEVRRPPAGSITAGDVFHPIESCPSTGTCRQALRIGDTDITPPERATIASMTVAFADVDPANPPSGCQYDSMVLQVSGEDDRTPREDLTTIIFVGSTAAEASTVATFDAAMGFDVGPSDRTLVSTWHLGSSAGHERDGAGLSQDGPFCFAISLMDWAGNIGERSDPACLDTTDPEDPAVTVVEPNPACGGLFCSATPIDRQNGPGSEAFALAAVLGMLIVRRLQ